MSLCSPAVGESEVITLGACRNQKVIGITTGATTTIDFPEGTGSPFQVGDAVSLTVTGQTDYNFTHKIVSSINNTFQIERDANAIAQRTRRGKGNIIMCSADVASALTMAGVLDYTLCFLPLSV